MADVRAGVKTSTIRKGIFNIPLGPFVFFSSGDALTVDVKQVTSKRFGELNEEDARREGARDVEALKQGLRKFYRDIKESDDVTVMEFSYTPPERMPGQPNIRRFR